MKLVVQVISAHHLMPKDGEGSASAYVEVDFTNQLSRTKTIHKSLNPVWNQKLSFDIPNTETLKRECIVLSVYNERRLLPGRDFLGRVKVSGSYIVKQGEEMTWKFPLESKWWFSPVKGDISLKLYTSDEPDVKHLPIVPNLSRDISIADTSHCYKKVVVTDINLSRSKKELKCRTRKNLKAQPEPEPDPEPETEPEPESESESEAGPEPNLKVETQPEPAKEETLGEEEQDELLKEPIEVKLETTCHMNRQQAAPPQPFQSFQKPVPMVVPVVPIMSYHQVPYTPAPPNPKTTSSDYKLHDSGTDLGYKSTIIGTQSQVSNRTTSTYDLVDQVQYLFVRIVKARDLSTNSMMGTCDPYIEIRLGNYRGVTRHFEKQASAEWNQVFAFSKENVQSTMLEVFLKDKQLVGRDDYIGKVVFDLNEVPIRVPPDSPLAPQWYKLDGRLNRGEVMLAVWIGTQADEAFAEACHADVASVQGMEAVQSTRSKVYLSPKLWYLRLTVIEAQDIQPCTSKGRFSELFVKAEVGTQVLKSKICNATIGSNLYWNQDLFFVVAEPFEESLVITIEDRVDPAKDELLARLALPLSVFEKRMDHRPVNSQWFNLESFSLPLSLPQQHRFASRLHLRGCLEGAYHVMDESTMYISDTRPTARQLWKQPIGVLEVGILGAQGLIPVKQANDGHSGATADTYCVAKYGQKWVRTRTVIGSLSPRWNEQYTWEVYDPCTVITFGVFDNCHLRSTDNVSNHRDIRIGKVRIRLSTLAMDQVHRHSYPLVTLHPSGVKKLGELHLAVRFTCLSLSSVVCLYTQPLLPKIHYINPLTVVQVEHLRHQAMYIVAARLARAEPPLRKEVVEYMLDVDSHMWSMRRSKANFFRVMAILSGVATISRWFNQVCNWQNPITSVLVHVLFLILMCYPELIMSTLFLYMFLIGILNYRYRPRGPPHMDVKLSCADTAHPDELDEEFDTFPTSKSPDLVRMRYDRLRSIAGRIQTIVGDVATQGERVQALLSWRDPRATSLFLIFCLISAAVLYATPVRIVALMVGLYKLRHPRLRSRLPGVPVNYFKRLPTKVDCMF
ncbi:C2 calcium/lipid-binding plant phosphoribosyltransferase family protein [Rhynchospora pubera]|uniref:C2 calcium/lipid-binding plant phosphoribosyltransferase family protein n=1 Tax=Rhynchospora pubera TaxID=906938 RepID=A0AAV8GZT4_9POAL|nr:C2 calcium/lipid-binding plant phosphoribosyltransferase family protein [Rhynchospora pubera]